MSDPKPLPLITGDDDSVPVFTCHVILSRPDEQGQQTGRAANLTGISATGSSERDVLRAVLEQFKAAIQKCAESEQPIPFINPPETPCDGEVERFIPMHL